MGADNPFQQLIADLRERSGLSLAALAERLYASRSYVHHVEAGRRFPDERYAALADDALGANGRLVEAWHETNAVQQQAAATRKALASAQRDSQRLLERTAVEDDPFKNVERLAVDYLANPAMPMLNEAIAARQDVLQRLQNTRANDQADLYAAAGRLSGVITYAALDLGRPDEAMKHAQAAWSCAETARDDDLKAWVRGTQSLIARFQSRYDLALWLARDGQQYAQTNHGTAGARLLSGEAQSLANLGDSAEANRTLNRALDARAHAAHDDTFHGLFTFSEAKQNYYVASSLIWLDGGPDAERAERSAVTAIKLWRTQDPSDRSLDDEALAHIYLATARLQLHELDGAIDAIRPILELPPDRQISWIVKRLDRIAQILKDPPYETAPLARNTREQIRTLLAS